MPLLFTQPSWESNWGPLSTLEKKKTPSRPISSRVSSSQHHRSIQCHRIALVLIYLPDALANSGGAWEGWCCIQSMNELLTGAQTCEAIDAFFSQNLLVKGAALLGQSKSNAHMALNRPTPSGPKNPPQGPTPKGPP